MITTFFPTKPPDSKSAQWIRLSLRLLGLIAWLLFALLCLTTTGCRARDAASVIGPNYFLGLNHDLYSVDVDTNQVAQLAAPDDGGIFCLSPDGAWIATVAPDRINLLRTDGSGERRLWNSLSAVDPRVGSHTGSAGILPAGAPSVYPVPLDRKRYYALP